jgi:hypothetical protein
MAVSAVSVGTAIADTSNVSSYASASVTWTANRLALVSVANADAADAVVPTSVTGNGLTWVLVDTAQRADFQRRVSVYRAWTGASPTPGAITVDFGGDAQQGCLIHFSEWQDTAGSGDNGASAIVQSVDANWVSTTNPNITLGAFSSTDNGTFGAFSHGATPTAGFGYTQLDSNTHASPNSFMCTEWQGVNDNPVDVVAGSGQGCGVAIEIAIAASGSYAAYRPMVITRQAVVRASVW